MPLSEGHRLAMLEPFSGKRRIVIDTDTFNEIDDQFAIVHALLSPERVTVEAIYAAPFVNETTGDPSEGMELSYQEILALLERLDISHEGLVYRGVTRYVGHEKEPVAAPAVEDLIAGQDAHHPKTRFTWSRSLQSATSLPPWSPHPTSPIGSSSSG